MKKKNILIICFVISALLLCAFPITAHYLWYKYPFLKEIEDGFILSSIGLGIILMVACIASAVFVLD